MYKIINISENCWATILCCSRSRESPCLSGSAPSSACFCASRLCMLCSALSPLASLWTGRLSVSGFLTLAPESIPLSTQGGASNTPCLNQPFGTLSLPCLSELSSWPSSYSGASCTWAISSFSRSSHTPAHLSISIFPSWTLLGCTRPYCPRTSSPPGHLYPTIGTAPSQVRHKVLLGLG